MRLLSISKFPQTRESENDLQSFGLFILRARERSAGAQARFLRMLRNSHKIGRLGVEAFTVSSSARAISAAEETKW